MSVTVPLRRIAQVVNGGTPTPDVANWNGDVAWATPVDLARVDGAFVSATDRTLTHLGFVTGSQGVPAGSVLLSTRAPIGYVAITDTKMAFNQGCKGLVFRQGQEPRFHAYQLWAMREQLNVLGTGSTFLELSTDSLKSVAVTAPDTAAQRRIADFLDDQMSRINEVLRLRSEQIEALEVRLASMRNSAFDMTCKTAPFKGAVWFREGPGIMAADFREEGTPLLRISNVRGGLFTWEGCNFVDPATVARRWSHFAVQPGEIITSGSASGGLATIVPEEARGAIPYTGLIRMRPRGVNLATAYLRHFLLSRSFLDQMDSLKTGIAIQHWGPYHLGQARIPMAHPAAQVQVTRELDMAERITRSGTMEMKAQIALLEERKRSLITAAVIGEFDVTTASGRGV